MQHDSNIDDVTWPEEIDIIINRNRVYIVKKNSFLFYLIHLIDILHIGI